ncbi:MAG: GNAT family N-acetyltransferase [Candidatus Bathyarchaeia archaeon]
MEDKGGRLIGLAPLYFRRSEEGREVARFIGGLELSDYLDFVVEKEMEKEFFRELLMSLQEMKDNTELDLHFIPEDSRSLSSRNPLFQCKNVIIEVKKEEVSPGLELPSTWEEYLMRLRQKDRHELIRKTRRAEASGHLVYYRTSRMEDLERDVRKFCELHRKSRETKRGFMDERMSKFFEDLAMMLFSGGHLLLNFLTIDGRAVASLFGIRYGKGISIYNSGFDPDFRHISPGIVLFGHTIREAIDEGCLFFDFLRGSEHYKYSFGAMDRWLYNMKMSIRRAGHEDNLDGIMYEE